MMIQIEIRVLKISNTSSHIGENTDDEEDSDTNEASEGKMQ